MRARPPLALLPLRLARPALVLAVLAIAARAETLIGNGRGVVDEIVADTATLAPVRARIPFTQFRYAHVDAHENVTFIADDPFLLPREKTENTHGIYRSRASDGALECLVGPDTVLPGSVAKAWLRGLQSDGAEFVFHGRTHPEGRLTDGLYHWNAARGLVRLAQTRLPAPGGGDFKKLGYAALDDGLVVFSALDSLDRAGLFAVSADGRDLRRLADNAGLGLLPPPADGLALFWFQPWLRDGALAFGALDRAGREGVWFAPFPPVGHASAFAGPEADAPVPPPSRLDLARLPVPEDVTLNYVESTATSEGWIAFNAGQAADPARKGYGGEMLRGETRYEGVFLMRGATAVNIVDTETVIPGRAEDTFTDFDYWTACDGGRVVFLARGRDGFSGIYLYDADESALYPIATTDDLIEGMRPAEFEFGARPLVGERCALVVRFAPGQPIGHGVYLATLHRTGTQALRRK